MPPATNSSILVSEITEEFLVVLEGSTAQVDQHRSIPSLSEAAEDVCGDAEAQPTRQRRFWQFRVLLHRRRVGWAGQAH